MEKETQRTRETILVLVLALIILYLKFANTCLLFTAIILGLIGLFIPAVAERIHWLWMKTGHVLGYAMSRILLSVVYFIVLFPLSVLSRIAQKNSLRLKAGGISYFKDRNHLYTKKDLEDMW